MNSQQQQKNEESNKHVKIYIKNARSKIMCNA